MERPVRLFSILFMRAYLPVFLWMLLIFVASTGIGAASNTSRIIGPILRWFYPDISDDTIWLIQGIVRKGAHITEYAILAFLMWRSRRETLGEKYAWHWNETWIILAVSALYAATDEFHQSFVSTRYGSPWDVLLDTFGAAVGVGLIRWLGPVWMRRQAQRSEPIDARA